MISTDMSSGEDKVQELDRGHPSMGNSHCHSTASSGREMDSSTGSRKASDTANSMDSTDMYRRMDSYSTDKGIHFGMYIGMDIHSRNLLQQPKRCQEPKGQDKLYLA